LLIAVGIYLLFRNRTKSFDSGTSKVQEEMNEKGKEE